jgi:H/ACA ribonucleoprotein complex subunit 4
VTGVLPITLLEATKVSQALLQAGKEYIAVMRLHKNVDINIITRILKEFEDTIFQKPPLRSSVKRQLRRRTIYYIKDVQIKEKNVLFRLGCQAGTYVRKLCHDIGETLGVGAHMAELRRTRVGSLTESRSLTSLHELMYASKIWTNKGDESMLRRMVRPIEEALEFLPKIYIRDSTVEAICYGADLAVPGILKLETNIQPNTMLGIYTLKGEIVALAKALSSTEKICKQEKGLVTDTLRVIMSKGTYPKMWKSHRNK